MPEEEYSDSGRAVYPDGLFHLLKEFNRRFPTLPIIITENGVADDADIIRPAYIAEHLVAIAAARAAKIPVAGYVFWTVSDNWEWADGYCPKFGLASVDRSTDELRRMLRRSSFELLRAVAASKVLTQAQADDAWAQFSGAVLEGRNRSFCRTLEGSTGMTGFSGLDAPVSRPLVAKDWRFGMWRAPPYADGVSVALRAGREAAAGAVAGALGLEAEDLWSRWEGLKARVKAEAAVKQQQVKERKAAKGVFSELFFPAAAPPPKPVATPAEPTHEEL